MIHACFLVEYFCFHFIYFDRLYLREFSLVSTFALMLEKFPFIK